MNNLTFKQKIIFGIIIAAMVIFILIYFVMNAENLTGKEGVDELSEEEGMLDIEDINETIEGSEENGIIKNGEKNEDIALNGETVNNDNNISNGKLENLEEIIVHITGEVNKPGIVTLKENSRIADAINEAGGATRNADLNKINLAYILEDGQKIYIPNKSEKIENNEYIIDGSGNNAKSNNLKEVGKVNINEAMQTELEQLPGIGPSLAIRIIEYREQNGKFNNVEDLQNVKGIGNAKFNDIKDKVTVYK